MVALVHGRGLGTAGIGPGVGLGEAERADLLAFAQGDQILLLLLLGAEGEDGPGPQGHMGRQDHACAAVHPGQLLHRDGVAHHVQPRPAVFFRVRDAHQSHLPQFLHGLGRETALLIHHDGIRFDLRLGKGTDLGAQLLVDLRGLEQHTRTSFE